ncbi:hypothetical protein [Massilia sp. CF038]|uniref:hypothetical protein n=1 Tax=Massilia sp. CF038 TaxID=1881045 RepID=UPI000918D483|nr:hypothetical protein [Massilia sp. CF038]SHH56119.1 hypothetical protein SAMN05428948_4469 [Massilia sp. CF038]
MAFQPTAAHAVRSLRLALASACMMVVSASALATDEPAPGAAPVVAPVLAPALPRMALRLPLAQKVEVHGAMNFDKAGGQAGGQILYPGGLAGLLVGIATHAAVSGGIQSAERTRMREAADAVLLPHKAILDSYTQQELMAAAMPQMAPEKDKRLLDAKAALLAGELVLDSVPVLLITQDLRAVVLEHAMSIKSGAKTKPYELVIRVVSPARTTAGMGAAYWFEQNGARLKQESARMLAESVNIVLAEMARTPVLPEPGAAPAGVFRTVRFAEGSTERIERAQIISERCGQALIRTLRGHLMSVPLSVAADAPLDPACIADAEPGQS